MSAIAHHHAEWLSLLEISGPFLSMPVLLRTFPQGLEAADPDLHHLLRSAYEEWANNQHGLQPDESIHTQWLRFVLSRVLGMEIIHNHAHTGLLTGAMLPAYLRINAKEHNELLFPDYALHAPAEPISRLIIQQYPANQDLNAPLPNRHWKDSPALRMMYLLRATNVRLGLITNGEHWMLIDAPRHETTAFISWYAYLWIEEPLTLRAFHSLLHQRRLIGVAPEETLAALLSESTSNQHEVTNQLGYQVRRAVEVLLHTLDRIDRESKRTLLTTVSETEIYNAALTVMMRLVFLLSAEERKLLPFGEPLYNQYYAASTLQSKLREQADQYGEEVLEQRYDAWSRLLALFRAVYGGVEHPDLKLLAYDGRLFDPDRFPFLEGRTPGTHWWRDEAEPLAIDNRTVLHLLEALQLLQVEVPGGGVETRRLSFRALDVEQIGHVYEGLLDHTARRADQPILSLQRSVKLQEGVEVALTLLEEHKARSEQDLLTYLQKLTGHTHGLLQKKLAYTPDMHRRGMLRGACDDDEALLQRVLPFAGLLRDDNFGRPLVFTAETLYMTTGTDRRTTGTHYTPPSLTEPLVQHTLDPLVYRGLVEGLPIEQCPLLSVREILNLKVCDFAVGSGAFLVQTCRYLANRLVEAWEELEWRTPGQAFTIEGQPSTGAPDETLLPADNEERLIVARRLVAERCLYGVDKNPMATEMAKLSLWLITLHRGRPFTFLDHALCAGDSLLGVNIKQLKAWSIDPNISEEEIRQHVWVQGPIRRALNEVLSLRRRLRQLVGNDIQRVEEKARLLKQANEAMELIRLGADLLVAITLHNLSKNKQRKEWKSWYDEDDGDDNGHEEMHDGNKTKGYKKNQANPVRVVDIAAITEPSNGSESEQDTNELPKMEDYTFLLDSFETARRENLNEETRQRNQLAFANMRERIDTVLGERHPFHWPLMFPEVFVEEQVNPGFAALVSNPPFQGGQRITGALGTDYRDYLVNYLASGKRGSADLCAYFFLRASDIVKEEGQAGLVATNTIAQGDTREVGLEQIVSKGWTIPRAVPSRKWPGTAALEIAYVWLRYGDWQSEYNLDEQPAGGITPALASPGMVTGKPFRLIANGEKSYIGSYVLGMGFVLDSLEAQRLIEKDPRNKDVLFPYLNGEDLNSRPDQSPSRWIINFHDWNLAKAEKYTECLEVVRQRVKPERDQVKYSKSARENWWLYERSRPELYNAIAGMERVLVTAIVTTYWAPTFRPANEVFAHRCCVFPMDDWTSFTIIQSIVHEAWAREYSSSLKTWLNYSPSDCFENFPFPTNIDKLEDIGERYYNHRQSIMLTRQEGLTKTYNRFHNPQENSADIVQLRELHREMDETVAAAYGWDDLALEHGFHETRQGLRYTISEAARREVLDRLLRLNHERYAEEVAQGLHDKGAKAKRGKKQAGQPAKVSPLASRARKSSDQGSRGQVRRVAEAGEGYEGVAGGEAGTKDVGEIGDGGELQQGRLFDELN